MIHRINSVAPDLDDRVIKPNQAREAINLRFGASSDDSTLSGGVLVDGMEYMVAQNNAINPYPSIFPQNQALSVVGYVVDYERLHIYLALARPSGTSQESFHQIVQLDTTTEDIKIVVQGGYLNFVKGRYVSMTYLDGLLYWTDNVNEPRMINVNKGIRTFNDKIIDANSYPSFIATYKWCFSQIKRAPQAALNISYKNTGLPPNNLPNAYWYTADSLPTFVSREWVSQIPYQFSYYYIYDNREESRLAPWTKAIFSTWNIILSINNSESATYLQPTLQTIVKEIVLVIRNGNDGVPYDFHKFSVSEMPAPTGTPGNYVYGTLQYEIKKISGLSTIPTPETVYDQRYDSVPLLSKTNEVIGNRLCHANVALSYTDYESSFRIVSAGAAIKLLATSANLILNDRTELNNWNDKNYRTFRPGSMYTIGLQLVDEYGRCTPVFNTVDISIPEPKTIEINATINGDLVNYNRNLRPEDTVRNDVGDGNNLYDIEVTIDGVMPSWAKELKIAITKNQTVNSFFKGVGRIYYWYELEGQDSIFLTVPNTIQSFINNSSGSEILQNVQKENSRDVYSFKGYGIELATDIPFTYNAAEQQYVKITKALFCPGDLARLDTGTRNNEYIAYKIVGQIGNVLLINEAFVFTKFYSSYVNASNNRSNNPIFHPIEIYTLKEQKEVFFYDAMHDMSPGTFTTYKATIYGDCYCAYFNKFLGPQGVQNFYFHSYDAANYTWKVKPYPNDQSKSLGYSFRGYFYSMNLTNIYSEDWNTDYGLQNIANTNSQPKSVFPYSIVFSDQYIYGTQVNGINKFNPLNIRQSPVESGEITRLLVTQAQQNEPGVMLCISKLGVTSFYYNAIMISNIDGSNNLGTTDEFLASQRPLIGQFGTSQPASISKTTFGNVYWWSDVVNDYIRYSRAGLERLGLTYMFSNDIRNQVIGKQCISGYDAINDEAILSPEEGFSYIFSERFKTFQGTREYIKAGDIPTAIIGMPSKTYYFLNGLYKSTTDSQSKNKFFDNYVNPRVILVTNEYPTIIKQWNSVKIYGPKPIISKFQTGDAEGFFLETEIKPYWYIQRKGEYDAAIRRALKKDNSPGTRVMESRILYSTFVFNITNSQEASDFGKINFIEIKSNIAVTQ
jgi:hypothetical protein